MERHATTAARCASSSPGGLADSSADLALAMVGAQRDGLAVRTADLPERAARELLALIEFGASLDRSADPGRVSDRTAELSWVKHTARRPGVAGH